MAKTWTEKFNEAQEPVVAPSVRTIDGFPPGVMSLLPTPRQVDDYIRGLPAGHHTDSAAMRRDLAQLNGVMVTCPAATGRHVRTVAEAAYEALVGGAPIEEITPFWRLVDTKAASKRSLACGVDFIRDRRLAEGLPE